MKKHLLSAIFIILSLQFLPAEDLPLLAVPNITAVGVSETLATTSRNMVETALIKTGKFTVLSYSDMEEILDAQAFSLSGCTDESCAIEIGELLAADNIVVGDLSAVGEEMVLSIRLVNVTTSRTASGEVIPIRNLEDMQEAIFQGAYSLAGMKYVGGSAVVETGSVYVKSPPGMKAEIFIDGKSYGDSPAFIENLPFGVHILEAKADDYSYQSEISIASKDIMEITPDISLLKGNLFLTIVPPSAEGFKIAINGEEGTDGLNRDIPVGSCDIRISGNGWYYTGSTEILQDKTERLVVKLQEAGSIQFFGPAGIEVSVKSVSGEVFPVQDISKSLNLPTGKYTYTISHEDYKPVTDTFSLKFQQEQKVNPEYEFNEQAVLRQRIAELEDQKVSVLKKRKAISTIGWVFTGLGTAGLGLSGSMEGLIQYGAMQLEAIYPEYSASTDTEEIQSLGEEISNWKNNIPTYRTIRNYSLMGGGGSLLVGGIVFMFMPRVKPIEKEIAELEGMLK